MDPAVVVDDVALGFEEWCLGRCVGAVQPASRWHDTPPRQPWRPPQHVCHRLPAPWPADLLRDPAVRDEVTRHQSAHGTDHLPLERRRLVILRPRCGSRRQGRARVRILDQLVGASPTSRCAAMMPAGRASWHWCASSCASRPRSHRLAASRSDHPVASGTRSEEPAVCAGEGAGGTAPRRQHDAGPRTCRPDGAPSERAVDGCCSRSPHAPGRCGLRRGSQVSGAGRSRSPRRRVGRRRSRVPFPQAGRQRPSAA